MLFIIYIFNRASEEIKLEEKKSDITYLLDQCKLPLHLYP